MKQSGSILTKAPALFAIGASALMIVFFILSFGSLLTGSEGNHGSASGVKQQKDLFSNSENSNMQKPVGNQPVVSGKADVQAKSVQVGNSDGSEVPPSEDDVAQAKEVLRKLNEKRDAYLKKRSVEKLEAIVGGAEEREKKRQPKRGIVNKRPGSMYKPVPTVKIGPGHNTDGEELYPFYGDDLDFATELVEKQSDADPYDYPEKADELAKPGSIWAELVARYKNKPVAYLTAVNQSAMCLLSAVYTGNCKYLEESFYDCVVRLGADRIRPALSEKCTVSDIWRETYEKASQPEVAKKADKSVPVKFGKVVDSETCTAAQREEAVRYIPPHERYIAPFGPPRQCKNGALQYPIAFGVPSRNVQDRLFPKLFDFNPVPLDIPPKPFTFNDEDSYQALAATSHFCMTHSRGGWDCGRHYEVMGAGCIPYFLDIHAAGPYILPQLPRKLLQDIVKKPTFEHIGYVPGANGDTYDELTVAKSPYIVRGNFNLRTRMRFINESFYFQQEKPLDTQWYWRTARKLLKFTQKYLTTEAMAAYMLKTMGAENAKNVLIISRNTWDNLHQSVVTGLDGLGITMTIAVDAERPLYGCHQIPEDLTEQDTAQLATLRYVKGRGGVHGGGAPWANRMRNPNHRYITSIDHVWNEIEAGKFDAAIYTYYTENKFPTADIMALKANTNSKVAILDHDDSLGDPRRNVQYLSKEVYFFSRELRRAYC